MSVGDRCVLSNDGVIIAFENTNCNSVLFAELSSFLSPYFFVDNEAATADFRVSFSRYEDLPSAWFENVDRGDEIVIRRSTAAVFNLTARGVKQDGQLLAHDRLNRTAYEVNADSHHITAYVSDTSLIHLIELVRYTALVLEESRGAVLLHASAAVQDDGAVLILGQKGAGKTTTLLKLVLGQGLKYLSGDKVLLTLESGRLKIRGWPDYPHIGIGSLAQFPEFARACEVDLKDENGNPKPSSRKELISPLKFRNGLPCEMARTCDDVRAVIFPQVNAAIPEVQEIPVADRTIANLGDVLEYPFEFAPGRWHGLFESIASKSRAPNASILRYLTDAQWISAEGAVNNPLIPN